MGDHIANTNRKALIDILKGIPDFALYCVIGLHNGLTGQIDTWLDT